MTTKTLRSLAAVLSIGLCTLTQAQSTTAYTAPAKWNNFYPASLYAQDGDDVLAETLPTPAPEVAGDGLADAGNVPATPQPMDMSLLEEGSVSEGIGEACCQAASAPWSGVERLPLRPCFGSVNLLFLSQANDMVRPIAGGLGGYSTDVVNPGTTPGFEAEVGRYICCGKFGVGVGYMLWNPESESVTRTAPAGSITPWMPAYRDVSINANGGGPDTVYNYITGAGPGAGAAGVRVSRDLFYQGIEANLYCFGLMGSRRVSRPCCNSAGCLGLGDRLCGGCYGYGGAGGPLTRPCGGRVSVMASHGFRWFQAKDRLDFDYNIDGAAGYQAGDIYECYHVENNLFGYQFGSQLTYCINACWSLNIGGKFGIYGNHAQLSHHLGSTTTAYRTGTSDLIDTKDSDTALATMGELDFGLGRRIGCAWTIRGGYRLWGISGVATAPDSITETYSTLAASGTVYANDSIVLQGGYIGIDYNW